MQLYINYYYFTIEGSFGETLSHRTKFMLKLKNFLDSSPILDLKILLYTGLITKNIVSEEYPRFLEPMLEINWQI